jgi:hypothetical protein
VAEYMPAIALAIVQVPSPLASSVESAHVTAWPKGSVTVQVTVPVGVTGGVSGGVAVTEALKVNVPPVTTPAALSVTVVVEGVPTAPAGAESRPSETTQVTVPMKATSQFLILLTPV